MKENRRQAINAADKDKNPDAAKNYGWDFPAWKIREGLTHCGKRVKMKPAERAAIVAAGGPADPWPEVAPVGSRCS